MNAMLFQVYAALFMVAVTIVLFVWLRGSEAAGSARRRLHMMARFGLDPGIATRGGARLAPIMKAAQRRCGNCRFEDRCELWLKGEGEGDNSFCPNARTFQSLTETGARAA
ncbi:MAG: DUF6455 family protein [Kiloniellales bacterium]